MSTTAVENYPAFIGGERVNGASTFEDIDPATGQPCATVARCFDDIEEARSVANGTDCGLIAAVWTHDVSKAFLRVRQVYINSYGAGGGVEVPFGGYKRSGHGREKGLSTLDGSLVSQPVAEAHGLPHSAANLVAG